MKTENAEGKELAGTVQGGQDDTPDASEKSASQKSARKVPARGISRNSIKTATALLNKDRITGNVLAEFKMQHALSPAQMADLFGVGFVVVQRELNRGDEGVESRDICFMLRIFRDHPELMAKDMEVREFYEAIGGKDKIGGPMFSLSMGREQSAYARYFESGKVSTSKSAKRIIRYAMRVSGGVPAAAFDLIASIAAEESWSRGFDFVRERTWNPKKHSKKTELQIRKEKEESLARIGVKRKTKKDFGEPMEGKIHTNT